MPWIIVIAEREALRWVLDQRRMAFRPSVPTQDLHSGDPIALYVTRGAYHNPSRDQSQIVALGAITSSCHNDEVTIGSGVYSKSCSISLYDIAQPKQGMPFRPLVGAMRFIKQKDAWAAYLRKTIVRISDDDFQVIREEMASHLSQGSTDGKS